MSARRPKDKERPNKKHKNFAQMIKSANPEEIKKILKKVDEIIEELNKIRKVNRASLNRPIDL